MELKATFTPCPVVFSIIIKFIYLDLPCEEGTGYPILKTGIEIANHLTYDIQDIYIQASNRTHITYSLGWHMYAQDHIIHVSGMF